MQGAPRCRSGALSVADKAHQRSFWSNERVRPGADGMGAGASRQPGPRQGDSAGGVPCSPEAWISELWESSCPASQSPQLAHSALGFDHRANCTRAMALKARSLRINGRLVAGMGLERQRRRSRTELPEDAVKLPPVRRRCQSAIFGKVRCLRSSGTLVFASGVVGNANCGRKRQSWCAGVLRRSGFGPEAAV